jgi:hypothetical protein
MPNEQLTPMMTETGAAKRPDSLTLGQYTPKTTRGNKVIIPAKLKDEPTVLMTFPHKVALNLDCDDGLVVFPEGVHEVPTSIKDHDHLRKNGVRPYRKDAVAETLGLTERHVRFLRHGGVQISSLAAAVEYVKNLEPKDRAAFYAEAVDWKEPPVLSSVDAKPIDEVPVVTAPQGGPDRGKIPISADLDAMAEEGQAKENTDAVNRKGRGNKARAS